MKSGGSHVVRERAKETMVKAKGTIMGRRIHRNRSHSDHVCYECGEPIYHDSEYFYEVWRIEPNGRKYTSNLEYRRVHTSCPNKD